MPNPIIFLVLLVLVSGCKTVAESPTADSEFEKRVTELKKAYAPDRRTDRVEVVVAPTGRGSALTGYTTVPAAEAELRALAATHQLDYRVRLLPADPGANYGLVRTSVANIRTKAGHSQELTSQALMGTPIALLDQDDGWYLIRTPDRYIAWLEEGAFVRVNEEGMREWFSDALFTCVPAQTVVRATPVETGRVVSEVVAGCLLQQTGERQGAYVGVRLPDDRRGWMLEHELLPYAQFATPEGLETDALLTTAYTQVGKPYLWGGTSVKAMDCSGFTKTAYYLNGYVIPRDASQQVHAGVGVALDSTYSELQRGDLLFFGNYRDDGSERITHVGFYLGQGRFLHAGADNDYITENSLLEEDVDFAAHRKASLLRVRRLDAGQAGVVPVQRAFEAVYTRSSLR